jgi:glycosyltransferase involved in cell wall biosynthesis
LLNRSLKVTALSASAQLGGTERVLLDFAARAFEHDIALRVLTPRDGPLIRILNQLGVPAQVVPAPPAMLRGSQQRGRLWSALPAAMALPTWARALRQHPFSRDARMLYSIGFKTHLATTFPLGKKVVWHLHEFPPETTGRPWRWLARRIPHALIANSAAVAAAWGGGDPERGRTLPSSPSLRSGRRLFPVPQIHVVPNGVDLDRFKPAPRTGWIHEKLGLPRDVRLIGMPAVFARWKGHEAVIEAFRSLEKDFPNVHLVFIGGSIYDTVAEREFGEQLNALIGGAARVHALPFQPKIESVYPELDLAVHYSLRPEPFGRVILEAMASGVPVLAAREGGPLEILGMGSVGPQGRPSVHHLAVGGWLVTPREPATLAAALREALLLPQTELSRIGQLGRMRAEDHFSARAFARRVAEILWSVD